MGLPNINSATNLHPEWPAPKKQQVLVGRSVTHPEVLWHTLITLWSKAVTLCFCFQNDVNLIHEGDKVGSSEATLLNMLGISPFSYGLVVKKVYDSGTVFDPKVLDLTDDDLIASFVQGVRNVAAVSLSIGVPTAASVPHSIINGFKNLLAVAAETDITFKEAEKVKEYLADPSKFAVAAAPVAAAATEAAAPAKVEEPEESEDDDMGFGLFD